MTPETDASAEGDLLLEPVIPEQEVSDIELSRILEAILMVVAEPVAAVDLARVIGAKASQVNRVLVELQADYDRENRGFELREIAGGWRIYSRPAYAPWVGQFVVRAETTKLTQAALETLAIIAYRQPITRAKIAEIRGVSVDSVMRTLLTRDLIEEAGTTVTGANLYRTTNLFLEKMGFTSLDELLPLAPFLPPREAVVEISAELEEKL